MAKSTAAGTSGLPARDWDPRRHIKEERSRENHYNIVNTL